MSFVLSTVGTFNVVINTPAGSPAIFRSTTSSFSLGQNFTASGALTDFGQTFAASESPYYDGISFTSSLTHNIDRIDTWLTSTTQSNQSVTGSMYAQIWSNNNSTNVPSAQIGVDSFPFYPTSSIGAVGYVPKTISGSVTFIFPSSVAVTATNRYWLIFKFLPGDQLVNNSVNPLCSFGGKEHTGGADTGGPTSWIQDGNGWTRSPIFTTYTLLPVQA